MPSKNVSSLALSLTLLITSSLFYGCGSRNISEKSFAKAESVESPADEIALPTLPAPQPTPEVVTFASVNAKIFTPLCIKCHTAPNGRSGVNLNSYEFVKANLLAVENAVLVERFMPPAGPVEAEAAALLKAWIDAGALAE